MEDMDKVEGEEVKMNVWVWVVVAAVVIGGLVFYMRQGSARKQTGYAAPSPAAAQATPEAMMEKMVVQVDQLKKSGVWGTLTLWKNEQGKVVASLELTGATGGHPAHLHVGACPTPAAVKYPLTSVGADGKSETILNVTLAQLKSELPLAVNVHKSDKEPTVYLACGNL